MGNKDDKGLLKWWSEVLAVIVAFFAAIQALRDHIQLAIVAGIVAVLIFLFRWVWKMRTQRDEFGRPLHGPKQTGATASLFVMAILVIGAFLLPVSRDFVITSFAGTRTPTPTGTVTGTPPAWQTVIHAANQTAMARPTSTPTPPVPPSSTPTPTPMLTPTVWQTIISGTWTVIPAPGSAISVQNAASVHQVAALDGQAIELAYSPDGRFLAASTYEGIQLYDAASLQPGRKLPSGRDYPHLAFFPGGRFLASGGASGIIVWNVDTGGQVSNFHNLKDMDSLSVSPDGRLLALRAGEAVILANAENGHVVKTIPVGATESNVAFSPDGRWLACAGGIAGMDILIIDTNSGETVRTLQGHSNWVKSLVFSADGVRLASADIDKTARLWDPATGLLVTTLSGHTEQVDGVSLSPDGAVAATISWDLTVRLWDAANGQPLQKLTGHTEWGVQVLISPDGKRIASRDIQGNVIIWGLEP